MAESSLHFLLTREELCVNDILCVVGLLRLWNTKPLTVKNMNQIHSHPAK